MTDDQGWFDIGFNGNKEIMTPNLDSMAAKGIILDRFYAASAVCSPTRASLLTGRNPLRMNIPYANEGHLKTEEITIPEFLKKEGYSTGHFGKWHLGTLTKTVLDANRGGKPQFEKDYSIPSQHGYDEYFCTESKVPTYDPLIQPVNFKKGESLRYGWRAVEKGEESDSYGTAYWNKENQSETLNLEGDDASVIMDRVVTFIENANQSEKPFFSTIWFHTPHLPVVSDKVYRDMYKDLDLEKQLYYGSITAMDEQMGRLWNKLEEMGIADNTLIFFCSDNGPERDTPGSAGIFRERKRSLYEGGVRVPAFVVWKNHLKGGQRIDFPMSTSDYLPTIVDLLGIKYPDTRPIDGISVLDVLKGSEIHRTKAIGFICRPQISWVTHQYKLITDENLSKFELYDLLKDKSEKNDIIGEFPEIAEKLKSDLRAWHASVKRSSEGLD